MEKYFCELTVANIKAMSMTNFRSIEDQYHIFSEAAKNCNTGVNFRRKKKNIEIHAITQDHIQLILTSAVPLSAPYRTLSAFSRELLRLDHEKSLGCFENAIYNHTLFNTEIKVMAPSESSTIEISDISNSQLLKIMVDLLYTPLIESEQTRTQVINSIKEIVLPFLPQ